jgi:hypothetical protein
LPSQVRWTATPVPTTFSPSKYHVYPYPCRTGESRGSWKRGTNPVLRIWYNYCLLILLQPFVRGSASLLGGLPSSLSGEASPHAVCRQASEDIILLAGTYQARHSFACIPPLLPHMVFAAVLDQLSLVLRPPGENVQHEGQVESPERLFPRAMHDTLYSVSRTTPHTPLARDPFAAVASRTPGPKLEPESSSPTSTPTPTTWMQSPRFAERRGSAVSIPLTCFSADNQAPRSSICSFMPSPTSDGAGASSPQGTETESDTAPASTPGELAAIGFLQLVSMGAQHPGAERAVSLLRTVGSVRGTTRPTFCPDSPPEPVPVPAWAADAQSDGPAFDLSALDGLHAFGPGPQASPLDMITMADAVSQPQVPPLEQYYVLPPPYPDMVPNTIRQLVSLDLPSSDGGLSSPCLSVFRE